MNLLLLNGSPKPGTSSSGAILNYIQDRTEGKEVIVEQVRFRDIIDNESKMDELMIKVNGSDILILAFPVYIDSLPYVTTRALDLIHKKKDILEDKERSIMIISNCGFPEPDHTQLSIRMLKVFSKRMKFKWKGALEIGGGGVISGKPLPEVGGVIRNIVKAIDGSMDYLLKGEDIPKTSVEMLNKPLMSPLIYRKMGNFGWRMQFRKKRSKVGIKHRPYDSHLK